MIWDKQNHCIRSDQEIVFACKPSIDKVKRIEVSSSGPVKVSIGYINDLITVLFTKDWRGEEIEKNIIWEPPEPINNELSNVLVAVTNRSACACDTYVTFYGV